MASPLDFDLLTQTPAGQVRLARPESAACQCVQIQFGRFVWQFPRQNLENLYRYIRFLCTPEGFAQNAYNDRLAVVAMAGHLMMGLLEKNELQDLQALLQQARLALLQRDFAAPWPRPVQP